MKTAYLRYKVVLRGIVFLFVFGFAFTQIATPQSWVDSSWPYRRAVNVSNTSGTDLTEHQVRLKLDISNFDFADALPDGSDLRITASNGLSDLPFWVESWVPNDSATIWVKIPLLPQSGSVVYLYYGNTTASTLSDGQATFDFFDDFESWDEVVPNSGWTELTPSPVPSADVTISVYNGKLYAFGGYGIDHVVQNNVTEYDPLTDTWTAKAPMPTNRWGMVSVEFNGLIYVFGGQGTSSPTGVVEVYDPVADSWTTRSNLPATISYQGLMGIRYGDRIHLFYRSYHYEYDPAEDSYTQMTNVPYPRTWATCALVGDRIHIIGGHDGGGGTNTNQVLDPVTDTWSHETVLPITVYGATRENPVIDGKIFVTHGWDDAYFFTTNFVYDPFTNTWTQRGSATYPRDGVGCGIVDNKLYVLGGRNVPSNTFGLTYLEMYDPTLDTWESQSGSLQWTTSGITYVYPDETAGYLSDNGLVIEQPMDGSDQAFRFAETVIGFGSAYAVDFNWNVTDIGGIAELPANPQGMVRLTDATTSYGSLYFYHYNSQPSLRWFTGAWTDMQTSTWNSWHNVSIIRNGANSTVVFDGNTYSPFSVATGGSGRVRFGVIRSTQYIDNVRVRKWISSEPAASVGDQQSLSTQWTGAVNSEWDQAANWTDGVPEEWSMITISTSANPAVLNGSLSVDGETVFTIAPGGAATITGDLTNSGLLTIGSTLTAAGSLIVNGTTTGNITYSRQLKQGSDATSDWHLAASPVATNSDANTGNVNTVYEWSEPAGSWTSTAITSVLPGHGYNIRQEEASDGVISFRGPIVNSDLAVTASSPYSDAIAPDESYFDRTYVVGRSLENLGGKGWNLLGNPYPSAINASAFIDANYNATPSLSQFDPNYVALYLFDGTSRRYYYLANSTGWPSGTDLSATHIQAGQGFFVLAMNDNAEFQFTRAMQEHSTATAMLKSGETDDRWPGLQLKVAYSTGEVITTVVYSNEMTTGVDPGYDVGLFKSGQDVELYTILPAGDNDINYTRQALPLSMANTIVVPVGVDTEDGGEVVFSAATVPAGSNKFWLEDRTAGTFTDLSSGTYTVTLPAESYGTGRFYIIASTNTPTGVNLPEQETGLRIWSSFGKIIIKGPVIIGSHCELFDLQGNRVLKKRLDDAELNTVSLPAGMSGVCLVRVTDGMKVTSKKVVVL